MAIFPEAQNQTFELMGNHMTGVATASRGARQVEMWRLAMDPGAATPVHAHDHEEGVLILAGRGVAKLGDAEWPFQAGDTLILPANVPHQITCTDAEIRGVAALPIGSVIRDPNGQVLDLPWRQ
jgi:quercetin dioxygenase-like cupin family protein